MNQITPWPLPKDDPRFNRNEFRLDWKLYGDYLPWIPGKIYRALTEIPVGGFLPRKQVLESGRLEFIYSVKTLMEDHRLTKNEALRKNHMNVIQPDSLFMFLEEHFDGFIFSILYKDSVGYISREMINMHRYIEIVHGKTKI